MELKRSNTFGKSYSVGRSPTTQKALFDTNTNWVLPKEFPNLSQAKLISLDLETKDPDLKTKGPGVRRDGYTCGIAVAVPEGKQWYLPFGHDEGKQFEKEKVIAWAKKELCRPNQPKVGANLLYDLDYLAQDGVNATGPFYDIQVAEPLIDENRFSYSLNALAKDYLDEQKNELGMLEAARDRGYTGKIPQEFLWRLPAKCVGPYAEDDVRLPLLIFEEQKKKLKSQNLVDLFKMETKLIPILLGMRRRGVRINTKKLGKVIYEYEKSLLLLTNRLKKEYGNINYNAAEEIAHVLKKLNIGFPTTPKSLKPSIKKEFLQKLDHPFAKLIIECRKIDKFIGTFLKGSIEEMLVGDRLHCQFNQLKSDEYGTVTGRFSSSLPNLQFIPARDEILGPLCRSLFIPERREKWGKSDYSQIELRILAHYARGAGAEKMRDLYRSSDDVDYHQWCADATGKTRKVAKTINFGIVYGMGAAALAAQLGVSVKKAEEFMTLYKKKLPFINDTLDEAMNIAEKRGYIKTLLGRRRRFDMWEPRDWELKNKISPSKNKQHIIDMVQKNGSWGIRRAKTYKAFNAADQGTAADIMKKSMVDCHEAGIFDELGFPLLTVHDELDMSVSSTKHAAYKEMGKIMQDTMELRVPLICDQEIGPNWGKLEDFNV